MISLDAKVYEVLALAMRYFFVFYGVMIVVRAFSWLRKDRRLKHKRLKQLPDAGTIGILTVDAGSKALPEGSAIPMPHEGVLGFLRTCDVVVPVDDVATEHIDFTFVDGEGLYIFPRRGCEAAVDGFPIRTRKDGQAHPMQHGSTLEVGQAVLRLGVFAGLNVQEARPVVYYPEYVQEPQEYYPSEGAPLGGAGIPSWMPEGVTPEDQPLDPWQGGDGDAQ